MKKGLKVMYLKKNYVLLKMLGITRKSPPLGGGQVLPIPESEFENPDLNALQNWYKSPTI